MRLRLFISLSFILLTMQPIYGEINFLSISDIHYGRNNSAGDGHDTGNLLFSSAMNEFSRLTNQVDFILVLGDLPTHVYGYSPQKQANITTVFQALYQSDKQEKPMFYIPGNNDSLQGNYQPFSKNGQSPLSFAPGWQGACAHCDGLMIDGSHQLDKGYYSSYVIPGNKDIVLIALNSIPFTKISLLIWPRYPNQEKDARQQLQWLESQLAKHKAKQLLIAMHVPPGYNYKGKEYWHNAYLKQFIDMLTRADLNYGQINLLTSHSHMDDIRKITLNNGKSIFAYATPSISRIHHNNPAMKVFELNNDLKLKDYTTYYTLSDSPWQNTYYHAIQSNHSLFPSCHGQTITNCLNALNEKLICNAFQTSYIRYGENPHVDSTVCNYTYLVNH